MFQMLQQSASPVSWPDRSRLRCLDRGQPSSGSGKRAAHPPGMSYVVAMERLRVTCIPMNKGQCNNDMDEERLA